ncbi:protein NRT1/ PTR FAMILY 5.4 [Gossypium raimondii]|uniref:protein NRT1/ PTR FAMILY 5.4 n=1 Tax=Gossypium raimondii TaxID=29730 RepID=UPI002279FC65|nr:protein NRT1/ PTR FAMILY 5.4 [Gossypium raimondii]
MHFFFVLITYITSNWKSYRLPIAAAIVNAQEGASLLVAAIVAYVADERLGRFKVVGYTTAAFITRLVILCFEYKDSRIFYVALLLVTLGKGGRSPTLKAFLKDQFGRNQNSQVAEAEYQNREKAEARHQF